MKPTPHTPDRLSTQEVSRWFSEEVEPHESSLRSYLRCAFPNIRDIDDLVQESLLRVWKARALRPIQSARAFLFGVAQHVAIDSIRKERRTTAREIHLDNASMCLAPEVDNAAKRAIREQNMALLAEALHSLPPRCREIVILRKLDRLSYREIAERLGIRQSTVETQIVRGMRKCARFLKSRGVDIAER